MEQVHATLLCINGRNSLNISCVAFLNGTAINPFSKCLSSAKTNGKKTRGEAKQARELNLWQKGMLRSVSSPRYNGLFAVLHRRNRMFVGNQYRTRTIFMHPFIVFSFFQRKRKRNCSQISRHRIFLDCPIGSHLNASNGNICEQCPLGSYSVQQNSNSCQQCPGGVTTSTAGATSVTSCLSELGNNWALTDKARGAPQLYSGKPCFTFVDKQSCP